MVPSLYLCHQSVRTGTEFLGLPGYDLFTGFISAQVLKPT